MPLGNGNGNNALLVSLCLPVMTVICLLFPAVAGPAPQTAQPTAQSTPQQSNAPNASAAGPSSQNAPEMTSHEAATTFQVNVRLVEVHVVVRNSHGQAVGNLHKEDFQLFDDRKPQVITKFSVEQPGLQVAQEQKAAEPSSSTVDTSALPNVPERYVAYLFDDVHIKFGDLLQVVQAADKSLDTLRPTDRAAVFTISGQGNVEFTDDKSRLRAALRHITPHPLSGGASDCPKMTYYIADLIQNQHDQQALTAVTADALQCQYGGDPKFLSAAQQTAIMAAAQGFEIGDAETNLALTSIRDVVRRLLAAPGQRSIVLVSPGFVTPQRDYDLYSIVDRATHGNVTINALDARGLYVVMPGGDISERGPNNTTTAALELQYQVADASADADVMETLADGTGGYFFHNNNDLQEGFRKVASAPEYYYVLGFSPQNLKLDGRFHKLKVTLNSKQNFSIQARRGYVAPKHSEGPEQEAKQEIQDALFSREELHDLGVDLHTQFFKASEEQAKLTVLAHIDVKQLHFRKADGRNNENLTIVSGIFDGNGNLIAGIEKTLQMRLRDETLANRLGPGLSVKSDFDLKPGSYLVRLVVRDEHGQIAAENGAVRIP